MRQRLAQPLGELGEPDRHRRDVDNRLAGDRGHFVDDAQVPFAQFMRRLRQFRVDDDDVGVRIVDHDLDRLHVDGRVDHGREPGIERIADDRAGPQHFRKFAAGALAQLSEIETCRREGVDQQPALAARQGHGSEPRALRQIGMDKAFGGFDQFVQTARADHTFTGRDGVEGLDRTGERAGMRHRGGAATFGRSELERDHRLAGRASGLAGVAEDLGIAHAFEIDHDHADRGIGREIGHQVRVSSPASFPVVTM